MHFSAARHSHPLIIIIKVTLRTARKKNKKKRFLIRLIRKKVQMKRWKRKHSNFLLNKVFCWCWMLLLGDVVYVQYTIENFPIVSFRFSFHPSVCLNKQTEHESCKANNEKNAAHRFIKLPKSKGRPTWRVCVCRKQQRKKNDKINFSSN